MQDSRAEIVVVSKLGAVEDCLVIANGVGSYGRRRIPQLFEEDSN